MLQLPNGSKASVAVRFCPQLFALRESKHPTPSLTNLPYRMVRKPLPLIPSPVRMDRI